MKRSDVLKRMQMKLPMYKQLRVIISSDVKNEADDQFAIIHQLITPMFDVRGIVAAHYESKDPGSHTTMEKSYQELEKLMSAVEMEDVPIFRGADAPLRDEKDTAESDGIRFIIEEALREDPRPLYITAQGALTDVAAALNQCPQIAGRMTVVWIGGGAYPQGGREFNLKQDIMAARAVFASQAALWQIPSLAYSAVEVTMAELAYKVRPCGSPGRYLYDEIEEYNFASDEPYELRKGENWCLGDSPVAAVLLQCGWRKNYHWEKAPYIEADMTYSPDPAGKEIRVYDYIDVRMLMEDFYAKLAMCYGR